MNAQQFEACRVAFVTLVKDENSTKEGWCKSSLKQHWSGAKNGFADHSVNRRFNDFKDGYNAALALAGGEKS